MTEVKWWGLDQRTALSTIAVESDEVARSWSLIGVLVCTGGVSGEKEDQQGTYDEPRSVKDRGGGKSNKTRVSQTRIWMLGGGRIC